MSEFFISIVHNSLSVKYSPKEKQYILTSFYTDKNMGEIIIPKQICKLKKSAILACIKILIAKFLNELNDDEMLEEFIEFTVPDASEALMYVNIHTTHRKPDKSTLIKEKYKKKLAKRAIKAKREKFKDATNVAIDFLNLINDSIEYQENQSK